MYNADRALCGMEATVQHVCGCVYGYPGWLVVNVLVTRMQILCMFLKADGFLKADFLSVYV